MLETSGSSGFWPSALSFLYHCERSTCLSPFVASQNILWLFRAFVMSFSFIQKLCQSVIELVNVWAGRLNLNSFQRVILYAAGGTNTLFELFLGSKVFRKFNANEMDWSDTCLVLQALINDLRLQGAKNNLIFAYARHRLKSWGRPCQKRLSAYRICSDTLIFPYNFGSIQQINVKLYAARYFIVSACSFAWPPVASHICTIKILVIAIYVLWQFVTVLPSC